MCIISRQINVHQLKKCIKTYCNWKRAPALLTSWRLSSAPKVQGAFYFLLDKTGILFSNKFTILIDVDKYDYALRDADVTGH